VRDVAHVAPYASHRLHNFSFNMSDETAPVTTSADQSIQETVEAPSTHTPAVGGVNDVAVKDETDGKKVSGYDIVPSSS
jgi:hypothetical protein